MSQRELFETPKKPVHYAPQPTPGLPGWRRIALCGVEYSVRDIDSDGPLGSSAIGNVTCVDCLRKREEQA